MAMDSHKEASREREREEDRIVHGTRTALERNSMACGSGGGFPLWKGFLVWWREICIVVCLLESGVERLLLLAAVVVRFWLVAYTPFCLYVLCVA